MSKLHSIYATLEGHGARTADKGLTAIQLAERSGMDKRNLSTALAQIATTKKGVVARELITVQEGERQQYRYWVTGPWKGRGEVKPVRRPTQHQGQYTLIITGPGMRLERNLGNGLLTKIIGELIEQ